jgi:hypothetical protein
MHTNEVKSPDYGESMLSPVKFRISDFLFFAIISAVQVFLIFKIPVKIFPFKYAEAAMLAAGNGNSQ